MGRLIGAAGCALALTACGGGSAHSTSSQARSQIPRSLVLERRPIGRGARFHPAVNGRPLAPCRAVLGPRSAVHVEVFAANRVVLVAAAIGARPPLEISEGRITGARCFGALVTLDPTGVVLVDRGRRLTVADLFRTWGQPLTSDRLAAFSASSGAHVIAYVNGRRWTRPAGAIPLRRHAEIVLELGPHVPPHPSYTFPPGL
jgi:hypothetical protein